MELVNYEDTEEDHALTLALETDPEVMSELGGAHTPEHVATVHRRRANELGPDEWWLKIVPEAGGPAVGTIGVWAAEHEGEKIYEVGWMVLPAYQGRGIASGALAMLIERTREAGIFGTLHAFPGVSNVPSNALCRKLGFTERGEVDVLYTDRPLRVRHWVLELDPPE